MWQILLHGYSRARIDYDVIITLKLNGREVIGPIKGQDLAVIAKYGGYNPRQDLLEHSLSYDGNRIEFFIEYTKG